MQIQVVVACAKSDEDVTLHQTFPAFDSPPTDISRLPTDINCLPTDADPQVALYNLFARHYQRNAMVEARKILGGAGPAAATLFASPIWAGISFVDLGRDAASGRVGWQVGEITALPSHFTIYSFALLVFHSRHVSYLGSCNRRIFVLPHLLYRLLLPGRATSS